MSHSIVSRLIISCVTFLEIWNFGYPFTAYLVIPPPHSFHSWGCAVCFLYTHKYFYLYDFKAYVVCAVLILSIPAAHSHILSGGTHYNQQQRLWCSFQAVKSSLYGFAYFYTSVHPAHNLLQKYAYFKQHLWKCAYNYRHSVGHQTECVFYGVRRNCVISNFFWTRLIKTFSVRGCLVTH